MRNSFRPDKFSKRQSAKSKKNSVPCAADRLYVLLRYID